jgi:hypothetical protein
LWVSTLLFATVHEPTPNLRLRQRQPTSTLVGSGDFTAGGYSQKMSTIGSLNLQCPATTGRFTSVADAILTKNDSNSSFIHKVAASTLFEVTPALISPCSAQKLVLLSLFFATAVFKSVISFTFT